MSSSPPAATPAAAAPTTPDVEASPAGPILSKTQQRKLARQQALAEAEAAAPSSMSGLTGPAMSVQEAEERLESIGSACGAVLGKRIKLLSKKAQRHQTYKDIPTETLNPDQVQALSKLDSLIATIKELDEMKKAVEVAELEQAAALRAKKYFDAAQSEAHFSHLQALLALSRLHALLFRSPSSTFAPTPLPSALQDLTAQEVAAVGSLQHALVERQQVGLVVELARGATETDVLEGVSFARVLEIVRSLPEPAEEDSSTSSSSAQQPDEQQAPRPPNTNRCYQPPIQFGSSGLLDENDPAVPGSSTTGSTSPDPSRPVQHASFASGGDRSQQQMSFGTAVEASAPSPAAAPEDVEPAVRGKAGLEGEGEALAAVDDQAATEPPSANKAEDADVVVERLRAGAGAPAALDWAADEPAGLDDAGPAGGDGATTPGGGLRKARGPRGPRNRGPKTPAAAVATASAGEGGANVAAAGEKPKRTRSPRQPRQPVENGTTAANESGERRRPPRPPRKEGANNGRATPTTTGEPQQGRRNGGAGGNGGGARREQTAAAAAAVGGNGESAAGRPPRTNGGRGGGGGGRPPASGGRAKQADGRPSKPSGASAAPALAAPVSSS